MDSQQIFWNLAVTSRERWQGFQKSDKFIKTVIFAIRSGGNFLYYWTSSHRYHTAEVVDLLLTSNLLVNIEG